MRKLLREFGEKNPENRSKMAKAAKRAIDKGDDSVYHNAYMSLAKGGASKEVMKDFGDKFEKEGLNDQPANNLANNESRNMKGQVKLTESQLHQIIKESVMRILNEVQYNGVSLHGNRPEDWFAIRDAHEFGSKGNERASKNGNDIIDTDLEIGRCTPEQSMGRWLKALGKGAEKSKMMGFRK